MSYDLTSVVPIDTAPLPRRRDELLAIATDLFASRGFAGTSMRDIAQRAGCVPANLYSHFRGKEALLLAILARAATGLCERLNAAPAASDVPSMRLEMLVRAHLAESGQALREWRIIYLHEEHFPCEVAAFNRRIQHDVLDIYVGAIAALPSRRNDDGAALRMAGLNVLGAINWHLRWTRAEAGAAERRAEIEAVVGFVLRGVDAGGTPCA